MSALLARSAAAVAVTPRAVAALALPAAMIITARSVRAAGADRAPLSNGVDWERIKRDQSRRERLAKHATSPVSSMSNQVDWERIKREQARRHRLAAHAMPTYE